MSDEKKDDPTLVFENFSAGELKYFVNRLHDLLDMHEYPHGGKGLVYIEAFCIIQHRSAGADLQIIVDQIKSIWSLIEQVEHKVPDSALIKKHGLN